MLALIELHNETGVEDPEITGSHRFGSYEIFEAEAPICFQNLHHLP